MTKPTMKLAAAGFLSCILSCYPQVAQGEERNCLQEGGESKQHPVELLETVIRELGNLNRKSLIERFWIDAVRNDSSATNRIANEFTLYHWKSRSYTTELTGVRSDSSAYALVRNTLTQEVDSAFIELDPSAGRIRRFGIRQGVRIAFTPADTVSNAQRASVVDAYVTNLANAGVFSGVVLFAHNGKVFYRKAFGQANRELGLPMTPETPINLASLSKLFIATGILRMVDRGTLNLSDPLESLLPDGLRSPASNQVQVRHLLSHTSGITTTIDSLAFPSGTRFAYSNFGYVILGRVIVSKTGRPFDQYLQDEIFVPLKMDNTRRVETAKALAELAMGYVPRISHAGVSLEANPLLHTIPGNAAGGLFASADDLLVFAEALRNGRLISPALVDQMRTPKLELGTGIYGFGVILWRGSGIWGHAGDLPGTDADLEIYGNTGYTAVVLANISGVNDPIRRKMAALILGPTVPAVR